MIGLAGRRRLRRLLTIGLAALVAMMIMVGIGTFSWRSLRELAIDPESFSVVMTDTVIVIVATRDLAKGMLTGVILSAVFFARKVGRMVIIDDIPVDADSRVYVVKWKVFFASAGQFVSSLDYLDVPGPAPRLSGSVHRQESSVCPAAGRRGPAGSVPALPPAGR